MGLQTSARQESLWLGTIRRMSAQTPGKSFEESYEHGLSMRSLLSDFEQFFREYEPRITGYLWRMVGDEGTACDLCQETFIRAWKHFDTLQTVQQPVAWLFRVATNLALNHVRARTRGVQAVLPLTDATVPAGSDPATRFAEADLVQGILAELPPKTRALLVLRDVYHFGFDELGTMLNLSPTATRMALSRARAQFRDRYLQEERD